MSTPRQLPNYQLFAVILKPDFCQTGSFRAISVTARARIGLMATDIGPVPGTSVSRFFLLLARQVNPESQNKVSVPRRCRTASSEKMTLSGFIDKVTINCYGIAVASAVVCLELARHGTFGYFGAAAILFFSVFNIITQNWRYDRLKKAIEDGGFDERLCTRFMRTPCGRSVVKAALTRTGHPDKYIYLKEQYPLTTQVLLCWCCESN
jgi:hypothetical protein